MFQKIDHLIRDINCYIKIYFGRCKAIYFLFAFYSKFKNRIVMSGTDLCIEGFPRMGDNFCNDAFKPFNPNVNVAYHLHSPAQLLLSKTHQIPCLIMDRDPLDSVDSIVINQKLSTISAANYYIFHHKNLLKYVGDDNLIIAYIDMINNNLDTLVEHIKLKCNRSLQFISSNDELLFSVNENAKNSNFVPENLTPIPTIVKEKKKNKLFSVIKSYKLYSESLEIYNKVRSKGINFANYKHMDCIEFFVY